MPRSQYVAAGIISTYSGMAGIFNKNASNPQHEAFKGILAGVRKSLRNLFFRQWPKEGPQ